MDIEMLQDLIGFLAFPPHVLRRGILCEVPRKLVNDVYVALASGSIEDWALSGTIPAQKALVITMDISGNGTGTIVDTGVLHLMVSDRLCIEPLGLPLR